MIIWGVMVIDAAYMMYSKFYNHEIALRQNGDLFSKILIAEAVFLFIVLFIIERFLFRKSRINKCIQDSPIKLIIPFYIVTILGTAFAQASIIWGGETIEATGNNTFVFVLYGIAILFLLYFFPWGWRLKEKSINGEQRA